jgi:hypothetical protein
VGATTLVRNIGCFLAVNEPVNGQYLVVEGWMPAFAYRRAAELQRTHPYLKVIAVGALPEFEFSNGTPREFAAVGSMVAAGIPEASIVQAMGGPALQDRTSLALERAPLAETQISVGAQRRPLLAWARSRQCSPKRSSGGHFGVTPFRSAFRPSTLVAHKRRGSQRHWRNHCLCLRPAVFRPGGPWLSARRLLASRAP